MLRLDFDAENEVAFDFRIEKRRIRCRRGEISVFIGNRAAEPVFFGRRIDGYRVTGDLGTPFVDPFPLFEIHFFPPVSNIFSRREHHRMMPGGSLTNSQSCRVLT